jgi:hypothetical protein
MSKCKLFGTKDLTFEFSENCRKNITMCTFDGIYYKKFENVS